MKLPITITVVTGTRAVNYRASISELHEATINQIYKAIKALEDDFFSNEGYEEHEAPPDFKGQFQVTQQTITPNNGPYGVITIIVTIMTPHQHYHKLMALIKDLLQ